MNNRDITDFLGQLLEKIMEKEIQMTASCTTLSTDISNVRKRNEQLRKEITENVTTVEKPYLQYVANSANSYSEFIRQQLHSIAKQKQQYQSALDEKRVDIKKQMEIPLEDFTMATFYAVEAEIVRLRSEIDAKKKDMESKTADRQVKVNQLQLAQKQMMQDINALKSCDMDIRHELSMVKQEHARQEYQAGLDAKVVEQLKKDIADIEKILKEIKI